jgi:hypothetical protein
MFPEEERLYLVQSQKSVYVPPPLLPTITLYLRKEM